MDEVARTTRPDRVVWCDGSPAENDRLVAEMLADRTLIALDPKAAPGSLDFTSLTMEKTSSGMLPPLVSHSTSHLAPASWAVRKQDKA